MSLLPLAAPLVPLALALLLISRGSRLALHLAPCAALPGLLLALLGPEVTLALPWLLLGAAVGLDEAGRVFLLLSSLLWLLAGLYASAYIKQGRRRFFGFFLLTMTGNLALPLAQDIVSFYLAFVLMTFAALGLVMHAGTPEAARAGRVYLALAVMGEGLLLAGFFLCAAALGGLSLADVPAAVAASANRDLIIALILLGFGVKAGAWLLHVWLPLAHPVAPTPASAVLSGAIIKAGLLGWLRFLPLGVADLPALGAVVMGAGLIAAYWGVVCGAGQRDPKTLLAYSSMSQMGLITIALGSGLFEGDAWPLVKPAILVYALHHAFAKGALFLGVGAIGLASPRQQRVILLGMLLPALALVGIPLTSGALAKAALKEAVGWSPEAWAAVMDLAMPLAAAGTALLMLRLFVILKDQAPSRGKVGSSLLLSWLLSLMTVGLGSLALGVIIDLLPATQGALFTAAEPWAAAWPLLLGGFLFVALRRWLPVVPAGDVLVLYQRALYLCLCAWSYVTVLGQRRLARLLVAKRVMKLRLLGLLDELAQPLATGTSSWRVVSLLLLLLGLALFASLEWAQAR